MTRRTLLPLLLAGLLAGCDNANPDSPDDGVPVNPPPPPTSPETAPSNLEVSSSAFAAEQPIPTQYTCAGAEISPPLSWFAGPDGTVVYALIMDDPDAPAGTWTHWVLWNIPGTSLAEGMTNEEASAAGIQSGLNSWEKTGYGGPCPPSGTHHYVFKVYALSEKLDLPSGAAREAVEAAMEGKVLADGQLVGTASKGG